MATAGTKTNVLDAKVRDYNPDRYEPGDWVTVYEDDLLIDEAGVFVKSEMIAPGFGENETAGVVTALIDDDFYETDVEVFEALGLMGDNTGTFTELAVPLLERAVMEEFTKNGGSCKRISLIITEAEPRIEIEAVVGPEFYDLTYRDVRDSVFVPLLRTAESMREVSGDDCRMSGFMRGVIEQLRSDIERGK